MGLVELASVGEFGVEVVDLHSAVGFVGQDILGETPFNDVPGRAKGRFSNAKKTALAFHHLQLFVESQVPLQMNVMKELGQLRFNFD